MSPLVKDDMVTYPISLRRDKYRDTDKKKRAKAQAHNSNATKLELYINDKLLNQIEPVRQYYWTVIAEEAGMSITMVKNLGFSIDCGHHGFTGQRRDFWPDQLFT